MNSGTKEGNYWERMTTTCMIPQMRTANPVEDPGDAKHAKEHIAQYFENLYQARPGKAEYEDWTEKNENTVNEIDENAFKILETTVT